MNRITTIARPSRVRFTVMSLSRSAVCSVSPIGVQNTMVARNVGGTGAFGSSR